MTEHITPDRLLLFRNGRLNGSDVLGVGDHLAACPECRAKGASKNLTALTDLFTSGIAAHPGAADLAEYLDHRQSPVARELVESHLESCADCRADLADLRAFHSELQRQTPKVVSTRRPSRYLVPALVAASIALAAVLWQLPARQPHSPKPILVSEIRKPWQVALNDAGTQLGLDSTGYFVGPTGLSTGDQELLASILRTASLPFKPAREISSLAGVLRGQASPTANFRLLAPAGTLVFSQHPGLNWEASPGATHYRVTIFSLDFDPVASSPDLTSTQWTVNSSLPRGATYSWQVTAVSPGRITRSPEPPQSEARFRVLDATKAAPIEALLESPNPSHLLLAAKMASLGLRSDALAQLNTLEQTNANVPIIAKLRASLIH